jgi:hypothetical protein
MPTVRELRAVARSGSVILQSGRDIITGNVFTGSFARLRDVWLDPGPVFDEVQIDQFAGREWLIEKIDRFIHRHDHGYVVIQAPAGIGKTMIAAWLAAQRGWPCHFTRRRKGRVAATALRNLAAQIIAGYQLSDQFTPGGMLPETAGEPGWFEQVLKAGAVVATAAGQRLVLIVDGLDEAETFDGDLPLGLPTRLPRGVVVVVTCRTGSKLPGLRLPWEMTTFDLADHRNLADMRLFLQNIVATDVEIAARLAEVELAGVDFVQQLLDRCGGVWVYLRYVLDELRLGLRSPLDLEELPSDLVGYYTEALRPGDEGDGGADRLRLLVTLAAVTEPLPAFVITDMAGLSDASAVEALCAEQLRPFLTCTPDAEGTRRYAIYHVSLRDYLHGADPEPMLDADRSRAHRLSLLCRAAHSRIADVYLYAFGGLPHGLPLLAADLALAGQNGGYALRNLAHHLERSHRDTDLHRLLEAEVDRHDSHARNLWYAAHDRAGSLADYLSDVRRAQRIVARRVDADLANRLPVELFELELRYAIIGAAIVSLTNNIPAKLIARLVQHGMWGTERAVSHAEQLRSSMDRAGLLALLSPHLSQAARDRALSMAIAIAHTETDPVRRSWIFVQIVVSHPPPTPVELLQEAVATAGLVRDDDEQLAWAISQLVPRLAEQPLARRPLDEAVELAGNVEPSGLKGWLLRQLIPHLGRDQLVALLMHAPSMTDDYACADFIEAVAPSLDSDAIIEALNLVRSVEANDDRALALIALVPWLPSTDRDTVVHESLAAARSTESSPNRAYALAAIADAPLSDNERQCVLSEAATAASASEDPIDRVWSSIQVARYLGKDKRDRLIAECLNLATTTDSDDDRAMMVTILSRDTVEVPRRPDADTAQPARSPAATRTAVGIVERGPFDRPPCHVRP